MNTEDIVRILRMKDLKKGEFLTVDVTNEAATLIESLTTLVDSYEAFIKNYLNKTFCAGCANEGEQYDGDNLCFDCKRCDERPDRYEKKGEA